MRKSIIIALIGLVASGLLAITVTLFKMDVSPNPFKVSTMISCEIPQDSFVNIVVTDKEERVLKNIVNKVLPKGIYNFSWDGTNNDGVRLTPNTYIVEMNSEGRFTSVKKFVILK